MFSLGLASKCLNRATFVLAALVVVPNLSMAGIVTMTFTQFFDYQGIGISGKPSATWTGAFDLATHPTSPFNGALAMVNADFLANNMSFQSNPTPVITLTWSGDTVTQIIAPGVKVGTILLIPFGYYYAPNTNGFYSGLPTDAIWFSATPPSTARNATASQLTITPSSVPEPSTFAAFVAIGLLMTGRSRFGRY